MSFIDVYKKNKDLMMKHDMYSSCILHLSRFVKYHDAIDLFRFIKKMINCWKMVNLSIIQYDNINEYILGFIYFLEEQDEDLKKQAWNAEDKRYLQEVVLCLSHLLCDDTVKSNLSSSRRRLHK